MTCMSVLSSIPSTLLVQHVMYVYTDFMYYNRLIFIYNVSVMKNYSSLSHDNQIIPQFADLKAKHLIINLALQLFLMK